MTKLKHFLITIFFLSVGIVKGYSYDFLANGIYYNIISTTDKTVEVTWRMNGYDREDIVIPQFVNYNNTQYKVIKIGKSAFQSDDITSIKLPEGLLEIGESAFQGCFITSRSINLPEGLQSIGSSAFQSCNITSIEIPKGLQSIGSSAFRDCDQLTSIKFPEELQSTVSIGLRAFENCDALTSIELPKGQQSIGERAFYGCDALTSIKLPEGLQEIGKEAFMYCTNLTSIELSEGLQSIGLEAFRNCAKLTSIKLPKGLQSIGSQAFYDCARLTSIELPEGLQSIGSQAFYGCDIPSVTIPESVRDLMYNSFPSAKKIIFLGNTKPANLTSHIADGRMCYVSSKANYGFGVEYANLSSLFEVGGVKYVLISAKDRTCDIIDCAYNSSAENIVIDSLVTYRNIKLTVKNINNYAFFKNDSIRSAVIKNNGYIGNYAFYENDSIRSAVIKNNGAIGGCAFYGCDSLENIILGNGVEHIYSYAFGSCTKLEEVTVPNNVPYLGEACFRSCTSLDKAIIGTGVKALNPSTFYGCKSLAEVTIGENVALIDTAVFSGCTSLSSITIPQATKKINDNVFTGCTNLGNVIIANRTDSITLGNKYTSDDKKYHPLFTDCKLKSVYIGGKLIFDKTSEKGYSPFHGNKYLKSVVFNDTEVAIYNSEFANCTNLQNIVFGKGITSIGNTAFANCSSLSAIEIPNEVKSLGRRSLYNCTALQSAKIGAGINTLEWATFEGCSLLKDVEIGDNVGTIAKSVFRGCSSLPRINIPQATMTVSDSVFSGCISLKDVIIEDRTGTLTLGSNGYSLSSSATSSTQPLFYSCPLDSVYIGGKIKYKTEAQYGFSPFFRNTSLRTVVVTDAETEIYNNEFYGCENLTDVVIGDSITRIGNWAFSGCSSLLNFSFGNSVKTIGDEAFSDCTSMVKLVSSCNVPPVCGHQALADIDVWNCTLYVPNDYIDAYYNAEQWWDFFFIDGAEYKVTYIIDNEYYDETMVKYGAKIELPTPTKKGYTFQGWKDVPETMPADNITLFGSFRPNIYTISYVVDGEVYDTDSIACDAKIVPITAPTKHNYTFSHWENLPETMPSNDITVTAVYIDKVKEVTVTINQYGSATYCSQYNLDFSKVHGLKAYAASGYNSSTGAVTLTRVMTAKAGMGLFIIGESGEYSVPVLDNTDDNSLNMLVGTLKETTINRISTDGQYYNYRYTIKEGESSPLFYRVNDGFSMSSGKAYLQIPIGWFPSESKAKSIKLIFDDGETTTDIDEYYSTSSKTTYYDLHGRKVSNPQKGRIYIVNGKKTMLN